MAEDLARALGRLEQQIETVSTDLSDIKARSVRTEEKLNRLAERAQPIKQDISVLRIEVTARAAQVDDHAVRIAALELPVKRAKEANAKRRGRMRLRFKQLGALIGGAFVLVEWIAKPIIGLMAETWWRGPPPGH